MRTAPMEIHQKTDAVCCVLANHRNPETIVRVLEEYIPGYTPLDVDYAHPNGQPEVEFGSETEMITFFCENMAEVNSFFWNKHHDNPHHIMVGAFFTSDGRLIMSLSTETNGSIETTFLEGLKKFLGSDVGTLSYIDPPVFEDGNDFKNRYGKK